MKKKIIKVDEDTLELVEIEVDVEEESVSEEVSDFRDTLRNMLHGVTTDEFYEKYRNWKKAEADFKEIYEPFKEELIKLHDKIECAPSSVIIGGAKLTYVSPSTRTSLDSKKLKEEEPEIAKKFTKTTKVSATVRIDEI